MYKYAGRFVAISMLALSTVSIPSLVIAQGAWPTKPVTMVVNYPPGGPSDIDARLFTQRLKDPFQQPFLVDNRPGAGGTIGVAFVAKAAPDGYTLMSTATDFVIAASLYKNLSYSPVTDFAPISMITLKPAMMTINPNLPIRSVPELLAYARANPGKLNFGTPGQGSGPHLAGVLLNSLSKTEFTFVHYKSTPAMALDQTAGRIDMGINVPAGIYSHVKSGKLRLLGTTGQGRSRLTPDVPSVADSVPGFEYTGWQGFLAPKGVAPALISRLNAEIVRLSKEPELAKKFSDDGSDLGSASTPEQFRDVIAADYARWRKVVLEHNIKPEE
jgi:tripartite-type tricarboxylate transporter receptor subunit TctC